MITTTVGSYPKVAEGAYTTKLIGAITKWQRKELDDTQLEDTYQEITRAVIQEQEQAGLDVVTDGQIRWEDLVTPIAKRLDGFEINGLSRWFNNNVYYRRPILHKAPVRKGPMLVEEYRFAKRCATRPLKAVLPGPYTFAVVSEDRHYKRLRPFVLALAEILNEEARALADAGAPLIQFDEPAIAFGLSAPRQLRFASRREAKRAGQVGTSDMRLAVEALGVVTEGVRAKTAVSTYFGSLNGALESLMRAKVDVIGVDAVSDQRTLATLKRVKVTKELALGCLDARNTKLESVKELHTLFEVVRKRVPLDRVYVNPNCGLEFLPHSQALAKVQRLVQAVRTYHKAGSALS
jgi:5-methyltetrahydropteroyltriglutamate--homocysteine methyltransferase